MTDFWNNSPRIKAFLGVVESILDEVLDDRSFPLSEATKTLVFSGGKMLRPALVAIGAGFGKSARRGAAKSEKSSAKLNAAPGLKGDNLARVAAAIEMLHTATLIHDDILDNADFRRGTSTLHTTSGTTNAILAGDWLFSRSFRIVADSASMDSARILSRLVGTVCSAEIRQDMNKFSFNTHRREYIRTIAGKTAALFALSLHVGAGEAGAGPAAIQALRRVGYNLGMAFQIIDDILDYESKSGILKKPAGNDIREGLCTLPLIFALESEKDLLAPLLRSQPYTEDSLARILAAVESSGGIARSKDIAKIYSDRAHREIAFLPAISARDDLSSLVDRLLIRTY